MKTKLTLILFGVIIFFIISIPLSIIAQTTDVLTQHNNLNRDGWDSTETILNTKNVKFGLFGKLYSRPVDDFIYAQLLIKNNVNIPGKGSKNIVYVATVNNSVYAFDADDSSVTSPYWQVNLTPSGMRPVKNTDLNACKGNYRDIIGNIGIIGTPVIDPATNTMYVVARSCNTNGTGYVQYLHALNITTGADVVSPQLITAQVNGTGFGSAGGILSFNPQIQNQRAGLLLLNGIVYICYASHCDWSFYHGWILGYDKSTLQQKIVYCTTPDGASGGMWMSGAAPSADDAGNLYVSVGNGTAGYNGDLTDIRNRSESSLKLKPSSGSLSVESFFTPNNYTTLEATDLDFGTSQFMLLPNTNLGVTACKDGHIYVINKDSMGGYDSITNQVVQTINLATNAHLRSAFAYYGGSQHQYVYSWSENGLLTAFPFDKTGDTLDVQNETRSGVQGPVGNSGAFLSVSSNGSVDSTAVLWATFAASGDANLQTRPGILHAFDAMDVTKELWNSSQAVGDSVGNYAKFNCPTIANGKVYLATFSNRFNVYGLTGNNFDTCNSADIALNKPAYASSTSGSAYIAQNAFDGDPSTRWSSEGGVDPEYIYVDLGARYDLCRVVLNWETALASNFTIDVSDDAVNWTTIAARTNNTSYTDYIPLQGTGRYVRMYGTARGGLPEWGYSLYSFEVYGTKNALDCPAPDSLWASNVSQNSATLYWKATGASQYHVQYKSVSDPDWTAVTVDTNFLVLNSLSCGTDYLFKVQGICSATDSSDFSTATPFSSLSCSGCNPLPTRWSSSDVGNVNLAGTSCFNAGVFTLTGSGDDIGGTADAFQFAYQTLNGDAKFTARVATLDNANASNKCGIMIRETLSSGSKYAFIGLTSSSGVTFETRSTTNGNSSVTNSANNINAPYWIQLTKSGSVFNAAISPDNVNYSPLGSTSDLGFGDTEEVYAGLAITSHDNNILSTGTVDNYGYTTGTLPIDLLSFNASLNFNHTVDVKWSTQAINAGYFVIERATSPNNFIALDSVQAINGQSIQSYAWTDNAPVAGTNYYRLRIVGANGNYSYSGIVTINVNNGIAPLIYPNPATSYINIVQGNAPIKYITLNDITGRMIEKLNTVSNAGTIKFSVSHIPKGIYFIEMTTTTSVYRSKIIID